MRNLSDLLQRVYRSLNRDVLTKEAIVDTVRENTGVTLDKDKVVLKNGVLEINTSPAGKSEINMKESLIKESLRGRYQIFVSKFIYK